ncbi:hypothetical protein LEP1GSC082_1528 [Leptospira kirschneri str. H2]|nr:hypothetical protein LEP1GSC082_1528 [Leptospira kirschneri str. H2]
MMVVKQRFCAKTGWMMILFVFYSRSPHLFFYEKINLR